MELRRRIQAALGSRPFREKNLKLAKEENVRGVVSLDYHMEVDSTYSKGHLSAAEGIIGHTKQTGWSFDDLIFTCFVISPAGRPLRTFRTRSELLEVFRDAIKGLGSLFQDAHILHQDVSADNSKYPSLPLSFQS
ncbi:hypothetical protein F5B20DRAFT_248856 [Whalleya microplaca]|nr:hypothetical protein F5B20DRAFT_248856 [Whalleya microplaca]